MGNICTKESEEKTQTSMSQVSGKVVNIQTTEYFECNINLMIGDILLLEQDVLVNLTDQYMTFSHPLAKILQSKCGDGLTKQCEQYIQSNGKLDPGCGMCTLAPNLNFEQIIHVAVPISTSGSQSDKQMFFKAIMESLRIADQRLKVSSIAFPALPSGSFGFQKGMAAALMFRAIEGFIFTNRNSLNLKSVSVIAQDSMTKKVYHACYQSIIAQQQYSNSYRQSSKSTGTTRYDENMKNAIEGEDDISQQEVEEWIFQSDSFNQSIGEDGRTLSNFLPGFGHQCHDHGFNLSVGSQQDFQIKIQESTQYKNLNSKF